MRVIQIEYRELFSTGNYTNATVGITVEINENENPSEALNRAKAWVKNHQPGEVTEAQYKKAKEITENPDRYMYGEVERAKITVQAYRSQLDDIPF